ncbi:MAG: DUF1874 domain-containing protein [Firmicutes bacterium]|nr:DUF1874 domain-containing protein [Bacillota bacterium]
MLYILNSMIIPLKEGDEYTIKARQIFLQSAKELLSHEQFVSAVGHQATADLLSSVMGIKIPMNRIAITLSHGDKALCFVLKQRLPEGVVIKTIEELQKVGYTFWLFEVE